jgi:SNF2 family DNA or RNA helicase
VVVTRLTEKYYLLVMPPAKTTTIAAKAAAIRAKAAKAKAKAKVALAKAKSKAKAALAKAKANIKAREAKAKAKSKAKAKATKAKVSKTKTTTARGRPAAGKIKKKVLTKAPRSMGEDGKKALPLAKKSPAKKSPVKKTPPRAKVTSRANVVKKMTTPKSPKTVISPVLKAKSPKPKIIPSKISARKPCIERSKLTLKEHQIRVVNHMKKHRGLIAYHAVGSGKTLTAVTASQCYLDDHPKGQVIIVTPVSLQENMKKEMRGYGTDPDKDPRYKFFTIQKFATTYKSSSNGCRNAMLIIDEAHELRTEIPGEKKRKKAAPIATSPAKAKLSRAGVAVRCAGMAEKVLLLTATAVYNRPQDMANLVAMVKGITPPNATAFQKILDDPAEFRDFFQCVMSFYDIPKDDNYPIFEEHYEEITMTKKYYEEYRAVEEQNSHLFDQKNPFKFLTGVRQASNALVECMKCENVLKRAKEGKKMVIYSAFLTFGVRKVQELFKTNKISYVEVTGTMAKKKRDEAVKSYNADKVQVMFITKAGGVGLDLKGTRYVIIMESAWNRATEAQVIGRAVRYKSHTHLPKAQQRVDAYHLLIAKPPIGKFGRTAMDKRESADTMIKELMETKDKEAIEFLKRLYPLSIEQAKCL